MIPQINPKFFLWLLSELCRGLVVTTVCLKLGHYDPFWKICSGCLGVFFQTQLIYFVFLYFIQQNSINIQIHIAPSYYFTV